MKSPAPQIDSKRVSRSTPSKTIPENGWSGWYFEGEFLVSPNNDRFSARCIMAVFFWRQLEGVRSVLKTQSDRVGRDGLLGEYSVVNRDGAPARAEEYPPAPPVAPHRSLLTDSRSEANGFDAGNS